MPKFIIKLAHSKKKNLIVYTEWSTVVDAPIGEILTKTEAIEELKSRYRGVDLDVAMSRLEKNGTSTPHYSLEDVIETNELECQSVDEIIEKYFPEVCNPKKRSSVK